MHRVVAITFRSVNIKISITVAKRIMLPSSPPFHDFQRNLVSKHLSSPHACYVYEFRPSFSPLICHRKNI